MSKTILIATDYSLESLNILKRVLQEKNALLDNTQYNILFVSGNGRLYKRPFIHKQKHNFQ